MAKGKVKQLYLVPILSKALGVLELLENSSAALSLEEIYQKTRISKTTIYRILKTFVHRGYVAQTPEGHYRLLSRPKRLRFGFAAQSAEMPFSDAVTTSVITAAAAAGVDLLMLDNLYDPDLAIKNAEEFVHQHVDLALEFQVEEHAAPRVAHILKNAQIPLIAIDVPHPNATYFGVDNFEVGIEAGKILAQHAQRKWRGKADAVLGIGFAEAGSFVESRIAGAFDSVCSRLKGLSLGAMTRLEGRGMRQPSKLAVQQFLRGHKRGQRVLVAAATDSSALGVLDAVRSAGREQDFAIAGQDCIPEALDEIRKGSALIGSVSHEAHTYGPRLISLGINLLRGNPIPPYNYVRHRVVTIENIDEEPPNSRL